MGMKEISAFWAKYVITPASAWKGDQKNDHAEGAAIGWLCEREGVHAQRAAIFGAKLPKKLPTNARGTSGLLFTFYLKIEELQEDRLPWLLILREP